jgi:hypothetical protein
MKLALLRSLALRRNVWEMSKTDDNASVPDSIATIAIDALRADVEQSRAENSTVDTEVEIRRRVEKSTYNESTTYMDSDTEKVLTYYESPEKS